ncbi:hypothetical protein [Lignipirellula cremea]|uniref:J domain-containing protein n=1 Tax=Lignipirellula cremea TaxID=2528010 RepID=A0A518E322_9BACT|nr:hypothetical protein [Lignipirellula cremea]QDU98484.1 hypothetical protein Pla8534_63530 [Lignipirellula cremea]
MKDFDPYYRWLGISPKHQPPDHYRLLGIEQFEADLDVIESAADRQMAYVRQRQLSQHAQLSQRICSELSQARACLLNPQSKRAYDTQLRTPAVKPVEPSVPEPSEPQGNAAMWPPTRPPRPAQPPAASPPPQTPQARNRVDAETPLERPPAPVFPRHRPSPIRETSPVRKASPAREASPVDVREVSANSVGNRVPSRQTSVGQIPSPPSLPETPVFPVVVQLEPEDPFRWQADPDETVLELVAECLADNEPEADLEPAPVRPARRPISWSRPIAAFIAMVLGIAVLYMTILLIRQRAEEHSFQPSRQINQSATSRPF